MTIKYLHTETKPNRSYLHKIFDNYLAKVGLRQTRQRKIVLDATLSSGSHVDTETIANETKKTDANIGLATVYRTLKMMTEAGILIERRFAGTRAIFEFADENNKHHDHLICNQCGAIIEFYDKTLEKEKIRVAKELGFTLINHKMELFANCANFENCQKKSAK